MTTTSAGSRTRGQRPKTPSLLAPSSPFVRDIEKGRWDVTFWALRFLGVALHPGQKALVEAYIGRDATRFRAAYLTIALSAGNRAGKTLALAVIILHACFYKMGLRPPVKGDDALVRRWLTHQFEWFHFGIQQEVGDLVFHEVERLHKGTHEAQVTNSCPLTDELGSDWLQTDRKWRGEYRWLVFHPALGGAEVHFRTTTERALGSLGKDMAGLSFDECGFEPNLSFIVNEVLHFRRLSTGGQAFLISTPSEAFPEFAEEWRKGDPEDPDRLPDHHSLRMSTRDNVGFGIDQTIFDRLVAGMPPHLVPQNVDGHFIEARRAFFDPQSVDDAFTSHLDARYEAIKGGRYVQGVDPALVSDGTWGIVLDVGNPERWVGVDVLRRKGRQTLQNLVRLIREQHEAFDSTYSTCITGVDVTGMGGKVFRDLLRDVQPLRGVEFGGTKAKKLRLLTDLKAALESGRLRFPREGAWLDLRRQLKGYRLDDRRIEQDAVMALAVAIAIALQSRGDHTREVTFDYFGEGTGDFAKRKRLHPDWERLLKHGTRFGMGSPGG
jgi:hypothetical protein